MKLSKFWYIFIKFILLFILTLYFPRTLQTDWNIRTLTFTFEVSPNLIFPTFAKNILFDHLHDLGGHTHTQSMVAFIELGSINPIKNITHRTPHLSTFLLTTIWKPCGVDDWNSFTSFRRCGLVNNPVSSFGQWSRALACQNLKSAHPLLDITFIYIDI